MVYKYDALHTSGTYRTWKALYTTKQYISRIQHIGNHKLSQWQMCDLAHDLYLTFDIHYAESHSLWKANANGAVTMEHDVGNIAIHLHITSTHHMHIICVE